LAFIGASISTVIISLRAFIRGFGRPIFNPVILANPPSLKGEKVYQPGFFQTTATAVGSSPFPARVTEQVSPVERSASYR